MSYFSQDAIIMFFRILQTPWTKLTTGPDLQPVWKDGAPLGFGEVWEISAIRQTICLSKVNKTPQSFVQESFQLFKQGDRHQSVGWLISLGKVKGELCSTHCLLHSGILQFRNFRLCRQTHLATERYEFSPFIIGSHHWKRYTLPS